MVGQEMSCNCSAIQLAAALRTACGCNACCAVNRQAALITVTPGWFPWSTNCIETRSAAGDAGLLGSCSGSHLGGLVPASCAPAYWAQRCTLSAGWLSPCSTQPALLQTQQNSHQRRFNAEAMMPVLQNIAYCKTHLQIYPEAGGHTCLMIQSWQEHADWLKLAAALRMAGRQRTGSRRGGQQSAQDC